MCELNAVSAHRNISGLVKVNKIDLVIKVICNERKFWFPCRNNFEFIFPLVFQYQSPDISSCFICLFIPFLSSMMYLKLCCLIALVFNRLYWLDCFFLLVLCNLEEKVCWVGWRILCAEWKIFILLRKCWNFDKIFLYAYLVPSYFMICIVFSSNNLGF